MIAIGASYSLSSDESTICSNEMLKDALVECKYSILR